MIRKNVIVSVLVAFMLTIGCFGILPTRSATPYDAWLDYNEDGTINMRDIGATVAAFGASGDPAKNVNVTNWPQSETPMFYEIRALKPACGTLWSNMNYTDETGSRSGTGLYYLIDDGMSVPPGCQLDYSRVLAVGYPFPTTWTSSYDIRYMDVKNPQSDYYIQGDVVISFPLYTNLRSSAADRIYFNITVYLQTVDADGHLTATLANKTVTLEQGITVLDQWKERTYPISGVVFNFTSPVMVHSGERLSILFNAVARTQNAYIQGSLYLYHNSTWNGEPTEFEVHVPIFRA